VRERFSPAFFSSPRRAVVIPLGKALLPSSSNLPGSRTERAAPPPLFGLAPHGVCPARRIAPPAVRSYRTFSPLPKTQACTQAPGGIFSVALSVKSALSEPPRPLAGMLPCGDRTFLPPTGFPIRERPPVRQARLNSRRSRVECREGRLSILPGASLPDRAEIRGQVQPVAFEEKCSYSRQVVN
jgi:hypothetical protein